MQEQPTNQLLPSKITSQITVYEGQWIRLINQNFTIGEKENKNYQSVERTTRKGDSQLDGVTIVPLMVSKQQGWRKLMLIIEFRPAIGKFVLELPAGLLEDEDYYRNAKRELQEETGYTPNQVIKLSSEDLITADDPGLLNCNGIQQILQIDADDEINQNPKQNLEDSQNIQTVLVNLDKDILENIHQIEKEYNCISHTKVGYFATGFLLALDSKL